MLQNVDCARICKMFTDNILLTFCSQQLRDESTFLWLCFGTWLKVGERSWFWFSIEKDIHDLKHETGGVHLMTIKLRPESFPNLN